ncbi:MAG: hypothetical protein ACKVZ0_07935 [Gemmatimonadales bacterium]
MAQRLLDFVANTVTGRFVPDNVTPFVVVYTARTGSNFLASTLDSHPDILCHHEVFNRGGIHRSLAYKNTDLSFGTVEERERDPWAFIRRIYSFQDGAGTVGFKLAPRVNDWALASLLLSRRVRKVLLGRRSWLHAYTSGLIAAQTQVWMQRKNADTSETPPKVRVEPSRFRAYARKRRAFYLGCRLLMRATGQPFYALDYEEIGEPKTMAALLSFLGVATDVKLESATARQNSQELKDRVENYQELLSEFKNTRDDPSTNESP